MNFAAQDELHNRTRHILSRCVDECRYSRREIARRSGVNKDTSSRMLAGTRDVTLNNARDIVIATGRDSYATLLLSFSDGDEFEWLWREPHAVGFLSEIMGA